MFKIVSFTDRPLTRSEMNHLGSAADEWGNPTDGPARFKANPQGTAAEADKNWERLKDAPFGTSVTR
jgi:hypothetical protein